MYLAFQKKKRKSGRRTLINQCLVIWAKIVKINGKCDLCGSTYRLEAHHICHRRWFVCLGWFLLDNGICLCWRCHQDGVHSMSFKIQQQYHKKILSFLEAKSIDYDVLYLRCKTRGVDLGLIKLALQKQFADLKT